MSIFYATAKAGRAGVRYPMLQQLQLLCLMIATAGAQTPVNTSGWNPDDGARTEKPKSWLEQHGRIAIVVVIGVLLLSLVIWYIVRSVRGMRRRLKQENENQLYVIQQMSTAQEHPPPLRQTLPIQPSDDPKTSAPQRY